MLRRRALAAAVFGRSSRPAEHVMWKALGDDLLLALFIAAAAGACVTLGRRQCFIVSLGQRQLTATTTITSRCAAR